MNIPVREGETIEGSRTTRNRPYPVLKCSSKKETYDKNRRYRREKTTNFRTPGRTGWL